MPKPKSGVDGAKELNAVLKALPADLAKNSLGTAVRAGAKVIQARAYTQLALAMDSRTVRKGDVIIVKRRTPKDHVQAVVEVGPPARAYTLRFLHDGTQPHLIDSFDNRSIDSLGPIAGKGPLFTEQVNHPGQQPEPWLRKAYFKSKDDAFKALAENLAKSLPRQVKKLVSSKYRGRMLKKIRRNVG